MKPPAISIDTIKDGRTSQRASAYLTKEIFLGRLEPGQRLGIGKLTSLSGMAAATIREALAGLVGRGLVRVSGSRAFYVADLNELDFHDLMHTRFLLEGVALRDSILNGGSEWESEVATALARLDTCSSGAGKTTDDSILNFISLHKAFHQALISASRLTRVLAYIDAIYDQYSRYEIQQAPSTGHGSCLLDSHDIDGHRRLSDAAMARDLEAASEELRMHLFSQPPTSGTAPNGASSPLA